MNPSKDSARLRRPPPIGSPSGKGADGVRKIRHTLRRGSTPRRQIGLPIFVYKQPGSARGV